MSDCLLSPLSLHLIIQPSMLELSGAEPACGAKSRVRVVETPWGCRCRRLTASLIQLSKDTHATHMVGFSAWLGFKVNMSYCCGSGANSKFLKVIWKVTGLQLEQKSLSRIPTLPLKLFSRSFPGHFSSYKDNTWTYISNSVGKKMCSVPVPSCLGLPVSCYFYGPVCMYGKCFINKFLIC